MIQLSKEDIEKGLNEIDKELKDINNKREVLGLIEGIINNVITHPKEEKYRKINKNKITLKYPYESLFHFLSLLQFKTSTDDDSYIKYSKNAQLLNNIIPLIYEHYNIPYDYNRPGNNSIKQSMKRSSMTNKMIRQSGVSVEYHPMKTEPCPNNNSEMKNTIYDSKKEEAFYKEQNEKEKKKLLEEIYNKDKMRQSKS